MGNFFSEGSIWGSRRYANFLGDSPGSYKNPKHENTTVSDAARRAASIGTSLPLQSSPYYGLCLFFGCQSEAHHGH